PHKPTIVISQDGNDQRVATTAQSFIASHSDLTLQHWNHPQPPPSKAPNGYYKLAQHFGWAFSKAFAEASCKRIIVLEDDIEVAIDFFDYFAAVAPVVESDATLLGATAWNDVGMKSLVKDPEALMRSDFFGGLGWLLTLQAWEELGPKWPEAYVALYWDDWLREPPQRKDRAFIRPEISRSYTFGVHGTSAGEFYRKYLQPIQLNDVAVDWSTKDVSFLYKVGPLSSSSPPPAGPTEKIAMACLPSNNC
ncbi:GNTI, partial [Symbiodinium sp. KB8]